MRRAGPQQGHTQGRGPPHLTNEAELLWLLLLIPLSQRHSAQRSLGAVCAAYEQHSLLGLEPPHRRLALCATQSVTLCVVRQGHRNNQTFGDWVLNTRLQHNTSMRLLLNKRWVCDLACDPCRTPHTATRVQTLIVTIRQHHTAHQ